MVDEEKYCGSLDIVVCVGRPARCLEAPLVITDSELNQLVCHSTAMYLPDTVDSGSIGRRRDPYVGLAMLLAGKRYASAMHRVSTDNIKDFSILLSSRTKCPTPSWYIIEQVLYLQNG